MARRTRLSVSVYKLIDIEESVIPVKTGIQCFECLLDPPVKPEDDKY